MSKNTDGDAEEEKGQLSVTPQSTGRHLVFSENEENPPHFEIHSYERSSISEEEEGTPRVLDPNHPLLVKFQKTLKEHLERQIDRLRNEVFELETGAKKKHAVCEQIGIETYEAQQVVNRQQQDLEMCVAELDHICSATEEMEIQLEEAKNMLAEKRLEVLEAEKNELHLQTEVESLNLLMNQMKQWENETESELIINQKIFEKGRKDKLKLADEKRRLDMIIYKLMTETWRLEEELETMDMQLRVKEDEREKLAEAIAANSVDIEALNSEHRCLLHSWNSVVTAISHRDKLHSSMKHDLENLNEKLRTITAEVEQTKKLCGKEMQQNERLTDKKCCIQLDIENCMRLLDVEKKKRDILQGQMNNTQMLIDQTEMDIKRITAENAVKASDYAVLQKDYEALALQKVTLEEQILKMLEEKLTNNKAASYLNKLAHQGKEKNHDMEINLANIENTNAKTLMDIEAQKCMNEQISRFLEELLKQQKISEDELKQYSGELDKQYYLASRKQRDIDLLNNKIETTVNKRGGTDISPEELKIVTLEKNIEDAREKIKELQMFWLRQQGHVVSLSQQRQAQINDINLLKKQMMLLVQKNLKINDELEAFKKYDDKLGRNIHNLQNRLVILNNELCRKKGSKDTIGKDNDIMQSEYMAKLQETEMESLKIESDIADIEEDKVNLSDELIELNREALVWEKKIQMAVETKKNMDEEKSAGGEVGTMKSEIHRMQVRLSHLKKAQDKLINDLEHCVSRRDAIITVAEAREKREKGGSEKTRINFARKLDDMRNRVKQMESEVEAMDKKMETACEEERQLLAQMDIARDEITQTKQKIELVQEKIEQAKTDRQRNLELLVLKQKKLKVYSELAKGRNPYIVYKTESSISMEYDKQKQIHNKLLNIVENLISDFPVHFQSLTRIYNTLKLPLLYLYQ